MPKKDTYRRFEIHSRSGMCAASGLGNFKAIPIPQGSKWFAVRTVSTKDALSPVLVHIYARSLRELAIDKAISSDGMVRWSERQAADLY